MREKSHGGTDGILRDVRSLQALDNIKDGIRYVNAHEITKKSPEPDNKRKYALKLDLRPYPAVRAMLAELETRGSCNGMDPGTLIKDVMADDAVMTEIAVSWPALLRRAQAASGPDAGVAMLETGLDEDEMTNFAAAGAYLRTRLLESGLFPWPKLDDAQVAAVFLAAALELRD